MSSNESPSAAEALATWSASLARDKLAGSRPGERVCSERPALTPVWVLLDAVCIRVPGQPSHVVVDGLDMTGQAPGLLSGWHKTVKGDWLGVVNFAVRYADGRQHRLILSDQLVPAYALRPREGGPDRI